MKGYSLKVEEFEWIWCNGVITHSVRGECDRYTKSTQIPRLLENAHSVRGECDRYTKSTQIPQLLENTHSVRG